MLVISCHFTMYCRLAFSIVDVRFVENRRVILLIIKLFILNSLFRHLSPISFLSVLF